MVSVVALVGVLCTLFQSQIAPALEPHLGRTWVVLIDAALLAAFAGGLVYVFVRALAARASNARDRLEESEERFRSLASLSADWYWEADAEGRLTWVSGGDAASRLLGPEPAFGRCLWDLPGLDVAPRLREAFAARGLGLARLPETEARRIQGGVVVSTHLLAAVRVLDGNGRFCGYRGIGREIRNRDRVPERQANAGKRFPDPIDEAAEPRSIAVLAIGMARGRGAETAGDGPLDAATIAVIRSNLEAARRRGDSVLLLEGGTLAVLCRRIASTEEASTIAQRLLDVAAAPVIAAGRESKPLAWGGIAFGRADGSDPDRLLVSALAALLLARSDAPASIRITAEAQIPAGPTARFSRSLP